jgi:hypothetical protein
MTRSNALKAMSNEGLGFLLIAHCLLLIAGVRL